MSARDIKWGLLAGTIATFIALTAGYWFPAIDLPRIDPALQNGNLIVPQPFESISVTFAWSVGVVQTFGIGAILAVIYTRSARQRLPGPAYVRGAIWGIVTGVVAGFTVYPLLYGGGVFASAWGRSAPIALVLWHLIWGASLGLLDRSAAGTEHAQSPQR